jgi:hypothetical protein
VKEAFDRRRLAIGQRETAAQIVKGKNAIEGSSGTAGARQANISAPFMKVGPLPAAITHCPQCQQSILNNSPPALEATVTIGGTSCESCSRTCYQSFTFERKLRYRRDTMGDLAVL